MKKLSSILSAVLCALMIACLAGSACAEGVPSSTLYKSVMSETFRTLVGGKSFEARVSKSECYGEDEDAYYTIKITACEETRFDAKDIENLKEHDIIAFAPGSSITVMEKTADESGFRIKDENSMGYFFSMARFRYEQRRKYLALAYFVPVMLHGTYDGVLMYMNNLNATDMPQDVDALSSALYIAFLVFFFFMWRAATCRVNKISGQ